MRMPAADRRGHHQQAAHGREDRAGLLGHRHPRARRLARGRRGLAPARPRRARRATTRATARTRSACASSTRPRAGRPLHSYAAGRAPAARRSTGAPRTCPCPSSPGGAGSWSVPLEEIVPYIDWTFFFHAWELRGKFPDVLDHPRTARRRASCTQNATAMLGRASSREQLLTASGVYGFWPAAADGDDIVLLRRRRPRGRAGALPHAAPAAGEGRRARPATASPTSWRRASRAWPTTSAPSR